VRSWGASVKVMATVVCFSLPMAECMSCMVVFLILLTSDWDVLTSV
jgi:hypothetical protein